MAASIARRVPGRPTAIGMVKPGKITDPRIGRTGNDWISDKGITCLYGMCRRPTRRWGSLVRNFFTNGDYVVGCPDVRNRVKALVSGRAGRALPVMLHLGRDAAYKLMFLPGEESQVAFFPRFPSSFPRSAWECRPRRSASSGSGRVEGGTRSVQDGIPTEDRGNEGRSKNRWLHPEPVQRSIPDLESRLGRSLGIDSRAAPP